MNKHGELYFAIDAGIEAASYDRSSTKRGHRREEVMEDFKERTSKRGRDVQVDVGTVMPGGGANPFAKGATVAVPQLEDKRA